MIPIESKSLSGKEQLILVVLVWHYYSQQGAKKTGSHTITHDKVAFRQRTDHAAKALSIKIRVDRTVLQRKAGSRIMGGQNDRFTRA